MTDDLHRRAGSMIEMLRQIPIAPRDAKRLPILGRMLGALTRSAGHGATLRAELEASYLAGESREELQARLAKIRDLTLGELEELRAAIDSWPARDPRPVVVAARILPRAKGPR